ncbi:hypothetical protein DFR49_3973 [Hephaestia caeni]|uniref:ElaB/YqjD/DUF883 family membrane-anchored ribosome-binding protein n=1 Tax=Hephaestia caeni TaxID=645617 RepID=A0A397NM65_9SPHN|nr:hypothetical protein [Hephaestia caeni]RIA36689.1 hypothetical protein DFR49_3973 [Hephaestia caeni]
MADNDTKAPGATSTGKTTRTKAKTAAKTVKKEAVKAKDNAAKTLKDNAGKLSEQASGKARDYAAQGKAKASDVLEEFSKLMTNAAGSVDERLGAQYGDYARSAAQSLSGFSQSLDAKDIDQLLDEARDFVRKSPAIAIGTAAAVGFVLARLVKSGFDTDAADDA